MLRQKIFSAFIKLSLSLLFVITTAAFFINQYLKTQDEINNLNHFGELLVKVLNTHGSEFLQNIHPNYIRMTLVAPDGTPLYDNHYSIKILKNQADSPEIIDALAAGKGSSHRYSTTMQKQAYYHARLLQDGSVLRLAFSSDSLLSYTARFTVFFIFMVIVLIITCYLISIFLAKTLIDPINKIKINTLSSSSIENDDNLYDELKPFLIRIIEQQHKIDDQVKELSQKNNEFQVITRSMSDGLVLFNYLGIVISMNKAASNLFGANKESFIGQNYKLLGHSKFMSVLMEHSLKHPRQTMNIIKGGREFELRFNTIYDNNRCLGYALLILDVTEKKRTEQIRQEFTANVSHELKTPLQSIIGYSELMASGLVKDEDIQPFAARINKQSTRLKTLIEDIIFLSYLDESSTAIFDEISLQHICLDVFESLQEKAQERHVELKLEGDDVLMTGVNRYIYELIYNLVDNGIRYNKENGSVSITLKEEEDKLSITVSDTGIGIAPEYQFRIFERFYRVDKSHSRKTGGTGLGLSIVKRVVLYHHGKIKIQSALGEGTTFFINFSKKKLLQLKQENEQKLPRATNASNNISNDLVVKSVIAS